MRERERRERDNESKNVLPRQQLRGPSKAKHEPKLIDLYGAGGVGAGEKQLLPRQQLPQSPCLQGEQQSENCCTCKKIDAAPTTAATRCARYFGRRAAGQQQRQAHQLYRQERQQHSGDYCTWPDDEARPRRRDDQQQRLQRQENCGVLSDARCSGSSSNSSVD